MPELDRPAVVVVGSLAMDLGFRARHRPGPGETLLGEEFGMYLGGKGFNQAVACRDRCSLITTVIACSTIFPPRIQCWPPVRISIAVAHCFDALLYLPRPHQARGRRCKLVIDSASGCPLHFGSPD